MITRLIVGLLVLWALANVSSYTFGGMLHLILVVTAALIVVRLVDEPSQV